MGRNNSLVMEKIKLFNYKELKILSIKFYG
jgi:hypothetical protein